MKFLDVLGKIFRKYQANFGKLLQQFWKNLRDLGKSGRKSRNILKLFAFVKFLDKFIND